MTVSTTASVVEYTVGGPEFPVPYRFLANADITAELTTPDGNTETLTPAQYTLSGVGAANGGTLTSSYAAGILAAGGATLTISRIMLPLQPIDLRNQGKYLAETQETGLDRLTMLIQQAISLVGRALRMPIGKNYYDALGHQIKNVADPTSPQDAATKKYVDDENALQDVRIDALSAGLPGTNHAFPWSTVTTQSTKVLTPGFTFQSATLAIAGATQTFGKSYAVSNNQILLAEAIPAGTEVSAILGQYVLPEGFVTEAELGATSGAGLVGVSHDELYPPATLGFRFKRTLHSKDAPFNCVADGVTDDSAGLVAMFAASRALGGNCEIIIDDGVHCCQQLLQCTSNTTIRFVGSLKATANPAAGTDTLMLPVNGATNVTLLNPQIDLNNIPAMNGIICRTGHHGFMSFGGEIKNGVHDTAGTKGGRGAIIETTFTSLTNRAPRIIGLRVRNCYMGFGFAGGTGTSATPPLGGRSLALVDDLLVDGCDIGIGIFGIQAAGSTQTYPYVPEVMQLVVGTASFRNCGINTQYAGQDGVIAADRSCNVTIENFSAFNTSAYGTVGAVVRGNMAKTRIKGTFYGDATSVVSFSPYKEAAGGPVSENSVQDSDIEIDVHGTVTNFLQNSSYGAGYAVRTTVSGSATIISSNLFVPANVAAQQTGLHIDLYERTQNSRARGLASAIGSLATTALPGSMVDLDLGRVGPLDCRGDFTVTSFAPSMLMRDQSASARDGKIMVDADSMSLSMESAQASEVFNPFLSYNAGTASARAFSGTTAVFGWNAGYIYMPALGNYANDAAAAAASVPVGGVYRNGGALQVRTV